MVRASFVRQLAGCALVLAGTLAWPASAHEGQAVRADVLVHIYATSRTGPTGRPHASAGGSLIVGESAVIGVSADFDGAIGAGGWPIGGSGEYAWRIESRLLSVDFEKVEIAVTWKRRAPGTRSVESGYGDTRTITLGANERHVLDLVHADSPGPRANIVVEIEGRRASGPEAHGLYLYDLWLVHEGRSGTKTTQHQSYGAFGGGKMNFAFKPLGFTLDGELPKNSVGAPLAVSVNGSLVFRPRSDGTIEVSLDTEAWLACGRGRSGGGGAMEYVARDGETISVEVPTSIGWCTIEEADGVPPRARPGVTVVGGGAVRVSSREFFDGDRLSLLVRIQKDR